MPENRHLRFLLRLLYAALALAGLWLCVRFLLPWLLPFLLAWGLAALLEPAVGLLMRRLRLPRWGAAALCTAALAAAMLGLLALALWRAWYELTRLVTRLPVLLSGLPALAEELEGWIYRFLVALPLPLQDAAREGLENLARQGAALPGRLSQALAEGAAGLAAALPSAALFLFTTLLAAYFTSAGRPSLRASLRRLMPGTWQERLGRVSGGLKTAFGGWLRAQGLLMLLTFGELALGFLLLRWSPPCCWPSSPPWWTPCPSLGWGRCCSPGEPSPCCWEMSGWAWGCCSSTELSPWCAACWSPGWWGNGWGCRPWPPWPACMWASGPSGWPAWCSPPWPGCWPGSCGPPACCAGSSPGCKQGPPAYAGGPSVSLRFHL